MSTFLTVVLAGLMLGVIYSLVGVGFGLVLWTTRIFHLAIATIYALAGYLCWQVAVVWDLGIGLGIVACLGAAILLGVAIEQFVYYPLTKRGSSFLLLFVASLGVFTIIQAVIMTIWEAAGGVFVVPLFRKVFVVGGVYINVLNLIAIIGGGLVLLGVALFLNKTKMGKAITAVGSDVDMARVVGIKVRLVRLIVFALSGAMAGVAVLFQAWRSGMNFTVALPVLLVTCIIVMITRSGDLRTLISLAMVLAVLQMVAAWLWGAEWQNFVPLVIFLVILVLRTVRFGLPSWVYIWRSKKEAKEAKEV